MVSEAAALEALARAGASRTDGSVDREIVRFGPVEARRDGAQVHLTVTASDRGTAEVRLEEVAERLLPDVIRTDPERPVAPGAELLPDLRSASVAEDLRRIVRCLDLTTLRGDDTRGRVRRLCARAVRPDGTDASVGPVAAVCVYPRLVPVAVHATAGTPVAVASVAGSFPTGLSDLDTRLRDISAAVGAGASEIDVVLDRSAFLDGRDDEVSAGLLAAREVSAGTTLKVILETAELGSPAAIAAAAELAIGSGADFIKTSTGAVGGATPLAVRTMAEVIRAESERSGRVIGLKVSGGVRTADEALGHLEIIRSVLGPAWLRADRLRFGASSLLDDLLVALDSTE